MPAVKVCGRKPTDAGADHDEVVVFLQINRFGQRSPVAQRVRASNDPGWLPRIPVRRGG